MTLRTKKHTGRRAFLRNAAGAAIALPLLEFTHGKAWAAGNTTKRFLTVFSHGGTLTNHIKSDRTDGSKGHHGLDYWRPAQPGEQLVLGPIHEPLQPYVDKLLLVEGINNRVAIKADPYSAGAHGTANRAALGSHALAASQVNGKTVHDATGPSIDHVVAERLEASQPTKFSRIHLKVQGHQYGTPFFGPNGEGRGGESDAPKAYETLFEGVGVDPEDPAVILQRLRRESTLDGLLEEYERQSHRVSGQDRHAIEAHLEHLYELEKEMNSQVVCAPPDASILDGHDSTPKRAEIFADMIVAALRCGLTNVACLEISDILTPWTEAGLQVESAHGIGHALGHTARDIGATGPKASQHDKWVLEMKDNRKWRASVVARILQGLDDPNVLEGDKTLLDNSLLLYTSEFRNAAVHSAWNLPVLLAGSAGGHFNTGRFVDYNKHAHEGHDTLNYDSDMSTHNLFTTILQAMGQDDQHFGNDDHIVEGPLPGLT